MIRIADQPVLLADTGPFCRCAEAGQEHLDAAVEYLRPNTRFVQDVEREINRLARTEELARLSSMRWRGFPASESITITDPQLLAQMQNIVDGRRRRKPGHYLEDRGEIATVLTARALGYAVLMDDRWGRRFAERKGLVVFDTRDLAAELAATQVLSTGQAWEIFRRVYAGSRRADLDSMVQSLLNG